MSISLFAAFSGTNFFEAVRVETRHRSRTKASRPLMSVIAIGTWLLSLAAVASPVVAGPEFPRVAIVDSTISPPEPFKSFLDQIRSYVQSGRLTAGTGDDAAKAVVLSHVSPDFFCSRDFGGVCNGQTVHGRLEDFLRRVGHWDKVPVLPPNPSDIEAWDGVDLTDVGMNLDPLLAPLTKSGEAYCSAELTPRSFERFQAAIEALMSNPNSGVTDELLAWYRLNGILGTWNVRAAPDIVAPVVGKVSNELAFFPGEGEILSAEQTLPDGRRFGWFRVSLHDGTEGYVAVDRAKLMTSLDEGFCMALEGGRPVITEHVGGGD